MRKPYLGVIALAVLLIPLLLAQSVSASVISFDFGAAGRNYGRGQVDKWGNWQHNPGVINNASTPGDPAVGKLAGFSSFNFWDALGFGEYPLDYGQTYDVQPGFTLPYYDGEFRVWDQGGSPYGSIFGGTLNLSTITMSSNGMGFSLTGTLTNMWFDDSIASSVLSDIANAPSADFTMYVAANKDLVDRLNRYKGGVKTTLLGGSISAEQAHATPEPSTLVLMVLALGMCWLVLARLIGPYKSAA